MLAFLNTPTFPVFSPPTYFNPAFILRFYLSFIFYLAFIYCVLLFTNILYNVMRTDTCNKPHTLRDAVTGRNRKIIEVMFKAKLPSSFAYSRPFDVFGGIRRLACYIVSVRYPRSSILLAML